MKKEDLVIGMNYYLDELEVQFIGYDPEYANDNVVLLLPLNQETIDFYTPTPAGHVRLSENVFIDCFDVLQTDLPEES